jgi:hypothetical protein
MLLMLEGVRVRRVSRRKSFELKARTQGPRLNLADDLISNHSAANFPVGFKISGNGPQTRH